MLDREQNQSFQIKVYRDDDFEDRADITAAASSSGTTLVIPQYKEIVKGRLLYIPRTGEMIRCTATPSSTSVTVSRGFGGTTGAALQVGDIAVLCQVAVGEGSGPTDTYSSEPWTETNYIETRRHGWKVTRHAEIEEVWGPQKIQYEEQKHLKAFRKEIEKSLLWGPKYSGTVDSAQMYTSGGIKTMATESGSRSLIVDWEGQALTRASFDNRLREYFNNKNGGGRVINLCGDNMITIINNWTNSKLEINNQLTDFFGTQVFRYMATNGETVQFMPHRLWTHKLGLQDQCWFIDLDKLKVAYVDERLRDITFVTRAKDSSSEELAANGYDYFWREVWNETGLKVKGTENICIFEGIHA